MSNSSAPHNPPFRAEHIGSLIRPAKLIEARAQHESGKLDDAGLRAIEDEAIRDVVALQEDAGYQVVTDGEFRRGLYSESFTTQGISGISNIETDNEGFKADAKAGHRMARRIPAVTSKIQWTGGTNATDYKFLHSVTRKTGKITLPGPAYIHYRAGRANISTDAYRNLDTFWADLVAAYHKELAALSAAGCTYVQIDETSLVKLGEERVQALLKDRGDDWRDLLKTYIEACNAVAKGAPKGMSIGIHVCRSQNPNWQSDIGYDPIAEPLFNDLAIDTYFLEYDNARAGTFEPLRFVPKGKNIVLGLVSSKKTELESVDYLKRRIDEAAQFVDIDQLALSPQCGFSTSANARPGEFLASEKAKLARIAEVAKSVWG